MNSFLKNITDKVFVNCVNNNYMTPTGCIPTVNNNPSIK